MGNRGNRRVLLGIVLALVPAAPIVAAIAMTSGSSSTTATQAAAAAAAPAPATLSRTTANGQPSLPPGQGAVVAIVTRPTAMHATPGGPNLGLVHTKTQFGSPTVLWVTRTLPGWLGVVSQIAGDGQVGWISASAARLTRVDYELRVQLSTHRLTALENGRVIARYPIAEGAPGSPTPTGRFGVTDRISTGTPSGPYGCCILALTAVSPHKIENWSGGNRVAIHSTPEESSIGQSVSHGCVRVTLADGQWLIDHIPLGTPTYIST